MQFNSIIFAAPKCSYSTNSLLKDLIYVPRCPTKWKKPEASSKEGKDFNTANSAGLQFLTAAEQRQLIYEERMNKCTASQPVRAKKTRLKGTIPCLFLDR